MKLKNFKKKFKTDPQTVRTISLGFSLIVIIILSFSQLYHLYKNTQTVIQNYRQNLKELSQTKTSLYELQSQDQYQINQELEASINSIKTTYEKALLSYEDILNLEASGEETQEHKKLFASVLSYLSNANYSSASAELTSLQNLIIETRPPQQPPTLTDTQAQKTNTPPDSGYRRQLVETEIGDYLVSIISADLNSTRVILDTAYPSDCSSNCPALSLSDYVSRNNAFAGVNGTYFCPASYPSCAGKENTFSTLLMNKDKTYFNSDNNQYSTVPAVIFSGSSARYISQSLEWGRDTSVDSVIANYPLLVRNNQIVFGGDSDPKKGIKSNRSFVGTTDNTVYIGVVHSATVAESAHALHALNIKNALNLDSGGSTALWSGGYKVGPGRNIPNALLFVIK